MTMIEMLLTFMAGIMYGLTGAAVARKVQLPLEIALRSRGIRPSSLWGLWASMCVAVFWPALALLTVFTTAYATLADI